MPVYKDPEKAHDNLALIGAGVTRLGEMGEIKTVYLKK